MKNKNYSLDQEEQEILEAFNAGKLKRVKDFEAERKIAIKSAQNYFKKNARLNIRLSSTDLKLLKLRAANAGLPYQTMIASILHQIALGHPQFEFLVSDLNRSKKK